MQSGVNMKIIKYQTEEPCEICKSHTENGNALHHIRSRGAYGGDESYNLIPLCKKCHVMVHHLGTSNAASRYPGFKAFLIKHGWDYIEFSNKWFRPGVKSDNK